jgi:flagellar protein FlaG
MDITASAPRQQTSQPQQPSTPMPERAQRALATARAVATQPRPAVSDEALGQALAARLSDDGAAAGGTTVTLAVDNDTGRVIGRVIDKSTGQVLRQIPSEEMLRLIAATKEMLGPMVDETV